MAFVNGNSLFTLTVFTLFLFSSLVALGLKQDILLSITASFHLPAWLEPVVYDFNKSVFRLGMLVSGVGSAFGCGFSPDGTALVNIVQIKLGTLACGSGHTYPSSWYWWPIC